MEEFKQYYKFPLKMWEDWTGKVFTQDNKMAFDWILPINKEYNEVKTKLLAKINGEDTPFTIKKSFRYEKGFIYVTIEEGEDKGKSKKIALIRGWGMLTGVGGYHLSEEKAAEIQDAFADYCVEMLNKK